MVARSGKGRPLFDFTAGLKWRYGKWRPILLDGWDSRDGSS